MVDSLWVQSTGVSYSAAEDRRLISAMYSAGIISGLTITPGTGLSVTVAAGRAIINDGVGGAYLAMIDTATTVSSLAAGGVNNIYITVDPVTAQAGLASGAVPTVPSLQIGSVTTSTSGVTSTTGTTALAEPPNLTNRYLKTAGGTMTGQLTGVRLTVPGVLDAQGSGLSAPKGVLLGGATYPTARHYARGYRDTSQPIAPSAWTPVHFSTLVSSVSDYGITPFATTAQGQFFVGPPGYYHLSGSCFWDNTNSSAGARRARIVRYNAAGTQIEARHTDWHDSSSQVSNWEAMMDTTAGCYFQFEVYQNAGAGIYLAVSAGTSIANGDMANATFRLIQAH